MNTQLDNLLILKLPNETKPESSASDPLADKARQFWKKTVEAGQRAERLPPFQRVKKILWDYNVGTVKGWFKGLGHAVTEFLDPQSDFYNPDYREIFRDVQNLPNNALDHGINYMDRDWEERGELNAERGVQGGLWILKIYFGAKGLTKGIFKGAKKLF